MFGLDSSLAVGSWCQGLVFSVSVCGELRPKHHFPPVTPARMNWGGLSHQHRILCSVLTLAQPTGVSPLTLCLCAQQCLMPALEEGHIPRSMSRAHSSLSFLCHHLSRSSLIPCRSLFCVQVLCFHTLPLSLWRITLGDPVCRSPAPLLTTLCPSWFSPRSPEPIPAALGSGAEQIHGHVLSFPAVWLPPAKLVTSLAGGDAPSLGEGLLPPSLCIPWGREEDEGGVFWMDISMGE